MINNPNRPSGTLGELKYSSLKFKELEERLAALERANEELRAENVELRSKVKGKSKRSFYKDLPNIDVVKKIFGIDAKEGRVVPSGEKTETNFTTFYQALFRFIMPMVYTDPTTGNERLVYTRIKSVSDEQYKVLLETLESVIDTMQYAQTKLAACEEETK